MNRVILTGNVATDIELKNSSIPMAKFNIAVKRAKDGTDFIPVIVWNQLAENVNEYCNKGSKILVEGRLQVSEYEQKKFTEVIADRVEFLSKVEKKEDPIKNISAKTEFEFGKQLEIEDSDYPWN